jgi:hypothetical protein
MTIPVEEDEWPDFQALKELAVEISMEHYLARELFGVDKKRVALLNSRTGEFFNSVGRALSLSVVRQLASILDSPTTGSSANITLDGVIFQSRPWVPSECHEKCKQIRSSIREPEAKLKKFRNKLLAHNDRATLQGEKQRPRVTHGDVIKLIDALFEILNTIQGEVFNSSTAYDKPIRKAPSDILAALDEACWSRSLRELVQSGEVSEELAGTFIRYGTRGVAWRQWCVANNKSIDWYLPVPKHGVDKR